MRRGAYQLCRVATLAASSGTATRPRLPASGGVNNAIANDSFAGTGAQQGYWDEFRPDFLASPAAMTSGYLLLELAVGGAGGSHWYGDGVLDRIGYLDFQLVWGDFDIAMELQVFNLAGDGLPPATGDARLAGLAAHDPFRPPGQRNFVHRMFGRAPGMEVLTDDIVEENKSNVDSISDWHTAPHPSPSDCRGWVRIRRVGSTFTSWVSADGVTWINEVEWDRPDLPLVLQVGPAIYSAATDADVSARIYQIINYRGAPAMSRTTAHQVDTLEWEFEGTQMPTPPTNRWLGASTTTPNDAGGNFTEPVGNGYARVEITSSMGSISSGGGVSTIANDVDVEFPESTGTQGTITHLGVFSASSGGTPYRVSELLDENGDPAPRTIEAGDVLRFLAGELVFTTG